MLKSTHELTQIYGPDVHFDVVGMPDPVFGDTVLVRARHWHPADERLDDYLGGSTRAMSRKEERAARARRHC
jgi:hypothetical protein